MMHYSKDMKLPSACIFTNQVLLQHTPDNCLIGEQRANKCDLNTAVNTNNHVCLDPKMDMEYSVRFQLSLPSMTWV